MPSSIGALFAAAGLIPQGPVRWGAEVPAAFPGVYVVALVPDVNAATRLPSAPVDDDALGRWLMRCPQMTVDGRPATVSALAQRLRAFWLPDEPVLYVGKATSLRSRVADFYRTPLGARGRHAGGHWLKTLALLSEVWVHWAGDARTWSPEKAEQRMLAHFVSATTDASKRGLHDPNLPLPFANLELRKGLAKRHGLSGTRCSRR